MDSGIGTIGQQALASYLARVFQEPVEVLGLRPLKGAAATADPKGFGYGVPFEVDVLPPFLAFRALVIAHPRWYPSLSDGTRAALLHFADAMLEERPFDPTALPLEPGGVP